MKTFTSVLISAQLLFISELHAQSGCTDPQANNYNSGAIQNNGSCTYNVTNLTLTTKANLATPLLDENSGIQFLSNGLWTFNDSGNGNQIYRVDSATGTVLQTVTVTNATNTDWEDITADEQYLYIGDFGNNNGNRTDLKIYRILINQLTPVTESVTADVINFSYSDQSSFPSLPNNNNYDCESVIYFNDSLHLFSKNWVDKQTKHYILPSVPGTYQAQLRETLNAGYLVTAATIQGGGVIALAGYDNAGTAPVFVHMLYDYQPPLFYNGNKRRFNVSNALTHGQVEGICFRNGAYGYISNERFTQLIFNVAPKLKSFNLATYLPAAYVNPIPVAAFSVSNDTICKKESIQFLNQSSNSATSYNWTFAGGTPNSSTNENPLVTFNSTGTFSVSLIATNASGSDTIIKNNYIKVNALPNVTLTVNGPTDLCPGDTTQLEATYNTKWIYQWQRNQIDIAGANNFLYSTSQGGNYKVLVTNGSGCSKISARQKITTNCRLESDFQSGVVIYPNPSSDQFTLEKTITPNTGPITFRLFDLTGRLLLSKTESNQSINFGRTLTTGNYILELTNGSATEYIHLIKVDH